MENNKPKEEDKEKYLQIKVVLTKIETDENGLPNGHFALDTNIHIDKMSSLLALKMARILKNEAIDVENKILNQIVEPKIE
jgi:hypothetical protein